MSVPADDPFPPVPGCRWVFTSRCAACDAPILLARDPDDSRHWYYECKACGHCGEARAVREEKPQ